eukprot:m.171075 g.171075  ORF g.171075 m.171075 type:complete len:904 (-) comp31631_c1_seq1:64-2775(-)
MAQPWSPRPDLLQQTIEVLRASHSPNTQTQAAVQEALTKYNASPEFSRYLLCVLVRMPEEAEDTRSVAGIVLKNNFRTMYKDIPPEIRDEVKVHCLQSLGEKSDLIRATVGLLITTISQQGGLREWPILLPTLMECISNPDPAVVQGAFSALQKVCEDSIVEISSLPAEPLKHLLDKLIQFLQHQTAKIRMLALSCLNHFIYGPLQLHFDQFLQNVFKLTHDPDAQVRKNVVQALVGVFEIDAKRMVPYLSALIEYMLVSTADDDEAVAQEACEFWLSLSEEEKALDILLPRLGQLLPVLLKHMRYSDVDIILLKGDEDDANVQDDAQDIRPNVVQSRRRGGGGEDSDDEDDDGALDALSEWSLRKSAAASLDVLSAVYGGEGNQTRADHFFAVLLPALRFMLESQEWECRESGILALGAIAEGCIDGLSPFLPALIPFLIESLRSEKALIRSISCWTISRYAKWILSDCQPVEQGGSGGQLFRVVLDELLKRVLDRNKSVQEAACSALCAIEEESSDSTALIPYLEGILQTFMTAHSSFQKKNMIILYDAIMTLADAVGEALNTPKFVQMLMPPLMDRWRTLDMHDQDGTYLIECLTSVALAIGSGFTPYCEEAHARCVQLIEADIQIERLHVENPENPAPEKAFVVLAVDLLSSITEAIGSPIVVLVARSNMLNLLIHCSQDSDAEVRQSSFALLGDYTKKCFAHIRPFLPQLIPILVKNLDPTYMFVSNNSVWAIGEIAMKLGEEMTQYLPLVLPQLVLLMTSETTDVAQPIQENTGITLGRVGLVCPNEVAAELPKFSVQWCRVLKRFKNNEEKFDAFMGICRVIMLNPQAICENFIFFCVAVCSWDVESLNQENFQLLQPQFYQILQYFKQSTGENWPGFFQQFPEKLRVQLQAMYNL